MDDNELTEEQGEHKAFKLSLQLFTNLYCK